MFLHDQPKGFDGILFGTAGRLIPRFDATPIQCVDMMESGVIEDHHHPVGSVNDILHLVQEELEQSLFAMAGDESEETTIFRSNRAHDIEMHPSAPAGDSRLGPFMGPG